MVGAAGALPAAVGADGEAPGDEADEVAVAARRQPKKKRRGIVGALAVRPAQGLQGFVPKWEGAETLACAARLHARHARGQDLLADGDVLGG